MYVQNVGETFRDLLRRSGMTQQELADFLDVSQSAVASWGDKERGGVPPKRAAVVAEKIGCDPERISRRPEYMAPYYHSSVVVTPEGEVQLPPSEVDAEIHALLLVPSLTESDKRCIKQTILGMIGSK